MVHVQTNPPASPSHAPAGSADERLHDRLRGLVLLAGSVRGTDLSRALARSVLDLPVCEGLTIISAWARHADMLAAELSLVHLDVRVLIDRSSRPPAVPPGTGRARLSVVEDRNELRGTGGLLRDISTGFGESDLLLVAHANQIVLGDFSGAVRTLAETNADVALLIGEDGTDHGVMLVRCGALAGIRADGFIDFKEQALPALAKVHAVRAVAEHDATTLPVRTARKYLDALRRTGAKAIDPEHVDDRVLEDWSSTFTLIEPGATVHPSALVHDSVVLSGATVGENAVLVRCVVGEGAVVTRSRTICDQVIPAAARQGEGAREARR